MAPILATATGVHPPMVADERLHRLWVSLCALETPQSSWDVVPEPVAPPPELVSLLQPYPEWVFEEQVDLHHWIGPLNCIDNALRFFLKNKPSLLLVPPVKNKELKVATSVADLEGGSVEDLRVILSFLVGLLRNATAKNTFQSVQELLDLLAIYDDSVADLALSALQALSLPPALHKQQAPENQNYNTQLHAAPDHSRLTALARGWGTRAMGLGLYTAVTADDSVHGQGKLLPQAGQLYFSFYRDEELVEIHMTESDLLMRDDGETKRRRVTPRSTAEIFFLALEKAEVPVEYRFSLLADVRLARSFHSQAARCTAVERRLRALTAILLAHPSQEVLNGYFLAQPELCVEIVDLLRPTVSSANVSSAAAIAGLSSTTPIPFLIRMLAVEALTAIIARREGSAAALTGSARLSSILGELGVGRGQYLGLLPTLIRYSLAPLGTASHAEMKSEDVEPPESEAMAIALAFVEATKSPEPPRVVQVQRALEFIDNILTLASAVISTPSSTSALAECGLVPALLSALSSDVEASAQRLLGDAPATEAERRRICSLVRFVNAQAVQILEGAVVTHNHALTAFHDLQGVDLLASRFDEEVRSAIASVEAVESAMVADPEPPEKMPASHRVYLFSILTFLTVMFHQESTSSAANTPAAGGVTLRRDEFSRALVDVLRRTDAFGGYILSLVLTLLSNVMNSDPQVVKFVHTSGLGKAVLDLLKMTSSVADQSLLPAVPAVPEVIVAIPNVIAALALTELGADEVLQANPFPCMLRLFYHENYAMPSSRCMLAELTAIVGTGLDEMMRHVEKLKHPILTAIVAAMNDVSDYADDLVGRENAIIEHATASSKLVQERSHLIQYVLNMGQLLEQVLHSEEHVEQFVNVGGLSALLRLFPSTMPSGRQLLAQSGCHSSIAVNTMHHTTIEDSFAVVFKCIQFKCNPEKLLTEVVSMLAAQVDATERSEKALVPAGETDSDVLLLVPTCPIADMQSNADSRIRLVDLSVYLRDVSILQWITSLFASTIKLVGQRSIETGSAWNEAELMWTNVILDAPFTEVWRRLTNVHMRSLLTVCRARTEVAFEERERKRLAERATNVRYLLRIVCSDGAVVRDGVDIDACANIGCIQMGELVEAYDRCINSSGILRYCTTRGWVSEMTRGHGREPIAECIDVWKDDPAMDGCVGRSSPKETVQRLELGVPDYRTAAALILARLQTSHSDMYGALSKLVILSTRLLTTTTTPLALDKPGRASFVAGVMRLMTSSVNDCFSYEQVLPVSSDRLNSVKEVSRVDEEAAALYFGAMFNHLQHCLFDEKRDGRMINVLMLVALFAGNSAESSAASQNFLSTSRFVLRHALDDFVRRSTEQSVLESNLPTQRVARSVAASLPPVLGILRRLISTPLSSSPISSVLSRLKVDEVRALAALAVSSGSDDQDQLFSPELMGADIQNSVSWIVKEFWTDDNFHRAPPFIIHPVTTLVGEIVSYLDEASKKSTSPRALSSGFRFLEIMRGRAQPSSDDGVFEPSTSAIESLVGMGFTRQHATDALSRSRTNNVEVAAEFALLNPPSAVSQADSSRPESVEQPGRHEDAQTSTDIGVADPGGNSTSGADDPSGQACGEQHAGKELADWIECIPSSCRHIIRSLEIQPVANRTSGMKDCGLGDGEVEATTVVICSFLLDICHRYPDKCQKIVGGLLDDLSALLSDSDVSTAGSQAGTSLASALHACVLLARALPMQRTLVLERNLVTSVLGCIERFMGSADDQSTTPMWLSGAVLFLDVMAHPAVAFSKAQLSETGTHSENGDDEAYRVRAAHSRLHKDLSKEIMRMWKNDGRSMDVGEVDDVAKAIAVYHPLVPEDLSERCADICVMVLRLSSSGSWIAPPGVMQATLSLLLRLLRAPSMSSRCLEKGVAEMILALPEPCKFSGCAGVATVIFRRLLEDESTLQAAMETEIRSTFAKSVASNDKRDTVEKADRNKAQEPSVPFRALLDTMVPLLCREPMTFLRVLSSSVTVKERNAGEADLHVVLASPSLLKRHESDPKKADRVDDHRRRTSSDMSPHQNRRSNTKKLKKDRPEPERHVHQNGQSSPAAHVTLLLTNRIINLAYDNGCEDDRTFLWVGDLLEILSDLILCVPGCGSAVHNYRSNKSRDRSTRVSLGSYLRHALTGAPTPPRSFVNFLLHHILPQDRWTIRNDQSLWTHSHGSKKDMSDPVVKAKKKRASCLTRVTHAAARVVLALAVRPGEGRKRTISDIVFALSGGNLGHGATTASSDFKGFRSDQSSLDDLHALQAWGEVCLALAAPRSNGKSLEGGSSLSLDNLRLMCELQVPHALVFAMHRVRLNHPMSSLVCSKLLLPLEILSRANVNDAIVQLAAKVEGSDESNGKKGVGHADIPMPDQGDGRHETSQSSPLLNVGINETVDDEMGSDVSGDDGDMDMESDNSEDSMEETDVDDESSSSEEGTDTNMEEEDFAEHALEDIEDASDVESEEIEDEADWNVDYGEFVLDGNNDDISIEDEDDVVDRVEQQVDEGWTRIESIGLGTRGDAMGARSHFLDETQQSRGYIDAAEAVIGSLMRTGEISQETLAEIESTLGIRISPGPNGREPRILGATAANNLGTTIGDGPSQARRTGSPTRAEVLGTVPHVYQRTHPDIGFSSFGGTGREVLLSAMESVFGGPSVSAANRNYDLVSPIECEVDDDDIPQLSQSDLLLFPLGPSATATSRARQSLHPLLCGVDLPPTNALVSDLAPHGRRAARRSQSTTRRASDWNGSMVRGGYLVSTTNGNIMRSQRPYGGSGPFSSTPVARSTSGPSGWSDDGLPLDGTAEDFGASMQLALINAMQREMSPIALQEDNSSERTPVVRLLAPGDDAAATAAASDIPNSEGPRSSESTASGAGRTETAVHAPGDGGESSSAGGGSEDGVASSLAAGLSLSSVPEVGHPTIDEADHDEPMSASPPRDSAMNAQEGLPSETISEDLLVDQHAVEHATTVPRANEDGVVEAHPPSPGEPSSLPNTNGLLCPPHLDASVFDSLPLEMQQDLVRQYGGVTAELDAASSLDPEFLAALPEEMRRELIEQDRQERQARLRDSAPADIALAQDMDNASFIASLSQDLREEILATADDALLSTLPPNIVAEAQLLRERASSQRRSGLGIEANESVHNAHERAETSGEGDQNETTEMTSWSRRKQRSGKIRVDRDRDGLFFVPPDMMDPLSASALQVFVSLMYLVTPLSPPRLLQRILQNVCANHFMRRSLSTTFLALLHDDTERARESMRLLASTYSDSWRSALDSTFMNSARFPPSTLYGAAPETSEGDLSKSSVANALVRRKQGVGTAASVAANLPRSAKGPHSSSGLLPVVTTRILEVWLSMCKASSLISVSLLTDEVVVDSELFRGTVFDNLLDLLDGPVYCRSASNLEQLLNLLEVALSPLSHLPKPGDDEIAVPPTEADAAAKSGKQWVSVPRVLVSQRRLQALCSILRMEVCGETAFAKVNTIIRRLCRVDSNRGYVLSELASVAHVLRRDALRDLKALRLRMEATASRNSAVEFDSQRGSDASSRPGLSTSVTLATSTSELKLLRVLQTLQSLCGDGGEEVAPSRRGDISVFVTEELVELLRQMKFDDLWEELDQCLKVVRILEGVKGADTDQDSPDEKDANEEDENGEDTAAEGKKLRNSAAGLLSRFLPCIESFFVASASAVRPHRDEDDGSNSASQTVDISVDALVGGQRVVEFVATNRVILNALIRGNSSLLDKGLRALVQIPQCRPLLDFDVKRQWFKTQMRRMRQHASRRHGGLRIHIRRKNVFEDAYHQLRLRNADEMRGRLHITFRDEEGVDAGGLSREFFAILAKEMFNPNYALFTSTEDGCTFQPNPHSYVNGDHLSYFRFVGRIVGKAAADGYLLDAHFTRSLYKHMLGLKPTHDDMEAIDPDYYKNLQTILQFNLADIGLDLTFSIEDHSFGESRTYNLIPDGKNVPVTEANKAEYVSMVCQYRMTTAIKSQIKAYLDGFHELISPDLVAIFNPRELELLISGLPDIDVADLKMNTDYVGWRATDKEIGWFWSVLCSLSRNEKAMFLQFVTGSSKVPLGGFADLQGMRGVQKFSIHKDSGTKGKLMSAHTCFNSLDLPSYESEDELREKLLYAINEGGGAFLFA